MQIFDPTRRFEKLPEVLSMRPGIVKFRGYDTVTGIEVTWHEQDLRGLTIEDRARLVGIAEVMKKLKFEALLGILHFWLDEEQAVFYFITESLCSMSVLEQLRHDGFHVMNRAIARWFSVILQALEYLHGLSPPIVHNRVDLGAVFVKPATGHVKMMLPHVEVSCLSGDGNNIKLWNRTPPEALVNENVPARDIWMFGLALLEAVTQEEPYQEVMEPMEFVRKLEAFEPPAALKKVEDPLLADLIGRCFLKTSERPSAKELLEHPFFKQDFVEETKPVTSDAEIRVIFSGKPATLT